MTRPVFIGGAGRSGTTLTVDLLGTHRRLSPVYETDFVIQLARALLRPTGSTSLQRRQVRQIMDWWTRPLPHRPHTKRGHETYRHGPHHVLFHRDFALARTDALLADLDHEPARDALRRFLDDLFGRHAALDGKPTWINKTPAYVQHLPLLAELYPDLLFVHCQRDGRAAVASALTRPWGPKTWAEGAAWWRANVAAGLDFAASRPDQVVSLRYEDLLAEPVVQVGRLLAAMGEDCGTAAAVVQDYRRGGFRFEPSRAHTWRAEAAAADVAAFEAEAGGLLARLGYGTTSGAELAGAAGPAA
jgi:hypothetical protein